MKNRFFVLGARSVTPFRVESLRNLDSVSKQRLIDSISLIIIAVDLILVRAELVPWPFNASFDFTACCVQRITQASVECPHRFRALMFLIPVLVSDARSGYQLPPAAYVAGVLASSGLPGVTADPSASRSRVSDPPTPASVTPVGPRSVHGFSATEITPVPASVQPHQQPQSQSHVPMARPPPPQQPQSASLSRRVHMVSARPEDPSLAAAAAAAAIAAASAVSAELAAVRAYERNSPLRSQSPHRSQSPARGPVQHAPAEPEVTRPGDAAAERRRMRPFLDIRTVDQLFSVDKVGC
jgi:hypothetical protein